MKQVMVVDNHPVMCHFLSKLLGKKGYRVTTAEDGLSALEMLNTFIPDVIFIDLVMPNISGEKVCQIIRNRPTLRKCLVVVLSAIMAEEAPSFETCKADLFIAKCPFNQLSHYVGTVMDHLEEGRTDRLKGSILGNEELFEREITKELLESKKHYETTLNHMSEGLLEIVDQSVIVFANPAATSILERPEEDLLSAEFAALFRPDEQDRIRNRIAEAAGSGTQTEPGELLELNQKCIDLKIIPVIHDSPRSKILLILRDVTLEKQLEEQLQRAKKMEAIGTLAGGVAHDLNNVLSAIVTYPDLLLPQLPEDSPLRRPIQTMRESGNKAVAIVQDLLTLARRGVPTKTPVNINDIVSEYLESPEFNKTQFYHPGVTVQSRLEDNLPGLTGSPVHLSKTVMNLTSNAVEAIEETGKVEISTHKTLLSRPVHGYETIPEGKYLQIRGSDTGSGIAERDMEHIFEPFYTKKKMGRSGTGLGMSVVWGTVKDHNGYIDVLSKEGEGTCVTLYFPIADTVETRPEAPSAPILETGAKDERVLVVDDVKEQREVASALLSSLGCDVDAVSDGEAAVEYVRQKSVDLLILDMVMDPGIDGLETYQRILQIQPHQKAIAVSGYSDSPRIRRFQNLDEVEFLKKPYTMQLLSDKIRKMLQK